MVVIAMVHGAAVAASACALGDQGPRHDGRLSLDPFSHIDLVGALSGIVFSLGWSKAVAVNPAKLRFGRFGLVIVVAAGLGATIVSAAALLFIRPVILPLLPDTASQLLFLVVDTIARLSLWFALLNALPIPPLTGAHLLVAAMPQWHSMIERAQPYGAIALLVLAATGILTKLLAGPYHAFTRLLPG